MLDFGFSEVLLTSAIALVVLGPEKLPKVARQVGNWMGRARLMARQLSEQLEREVNAEELLKQQTRSSVPASPAVLPAPTGATSPTGALPPTGAADPADAAAMPVVAPPVRRPPHPNSPEVMHANSPAVQSPAAMHPEAPPTQTSVEPQQPTQ
jgi:Tat protein translocase TatB subunit